MAIRICPSILNADHTRLFEEIDQVSTADLLHLDVMDNRFVPNQTFSLEECRDIIAHSTIPVDAHLMIADPDKYAPIFIEAGADQVSIHQEVCPHLDRALRNIQSEGALAGVVLNPSTPVAVLEDVLDIVDFVLIMSVNPGFGGQSFIPRALHKVQTLARMRAERGLDFKIEIDGGASLKNLPDIVRAGVDWVVAGSSVFHTADPAATVAQMREIARDAMLLKV